MDKRWLIAIVPGILAIIGLVFLVFLLLIKVLWAWTIPDLFPGTVEQGLVASDISWFTAPKLAIFIAMLAGIAVYGRAIHQASTIYTGSRKCRV